MKTLLPFLILFLFGIQLSSQERIPVDLVKTQFNINILAPGLGLEFGLNDRLSFAIDGGITNLFATSNSDEVEVSITPYVQGALRNYYPRKRVKKQLRPNSGNYISLIGGYNFRSTNDNISDANTRAETFYLGPAWGIQRNYLSGIHLGFSIGPGLAIGNDGSFFTFVGGFEFGFVIGGKNR